MKKYLCVIGYPLKHTISPVFQQAALDHYGLDIEYEVWETQPLQLSAAVGELRYPRNIGANVTIPYKEEVMGFLDGVDEAADEIGAVNTICKEDSTLVGLNTDGSGFIRALREEGGFDPEGKKAVVLGAGGAARAVCHAMLLSGVSTITVINRSVERAEVLSEALRDYIAGKGRESAVEIAPWGGKEIEAVLERCDLLVNTTPVGMKHGGQEKRSPLATKQIPSHLLVYDLVYNPAETPLLKAASAAGARTLGGLPMLVYQGAAAFELWTGKKAPVEVMLKAAREALT